MKTQTPAVSAVASPSCSLSRRVAFLVSTAMEASLALRFLMASRRRRKNLGEQTTKQRVKQIRWEVKIKICLNTFLYRPYIHTHTHRLTDSHTLFPWSGGSGVVLAAYHHCNGQEAGNWRWLWTSASFDFRSAKFLPLPPSAAPAHTRNTHAVLWWVLVFNELSILQAQLKHNSRHVQTQSEKKRKKT